MTPRFFANPSPQTPPLRLTCLVLMVALGCGGPAHSGDPTDAPMETSDVRAELPDVGGELPDAEQDGKGNPWPEVSHLVFATEFSADQVATDDDVCFGDITGLEGLETGAPFGQARLYFEGGDVAQRSVDIVADPDDPTGNTVLYLRIDEPNVISGAKCGDNPIPEDPCASAATAAKHKSRIQFVLLDNVGLKSFNYRVRLRLGAGFGVLAQETFAQNTPGRAPLDLHWMTIAEFWNDLPNENDYPFRVTLGAHPHLEKGIVLTLKGDKRVTQPDGTFKWEHLWDEEEYVADFEVPIEQWFTIHLSMVEGDASTGRTVLSLVESDGSLTPLLDVQGFTHHPDMPASMLNGFKDINPIKLYTSGELTCGLKAAGLPLEIWWDDFAIGAPAP